MSNGRAWCRTELDHLDMLLADGGALQALAVQIDRTPEAILVKAHKVLKQAHG
jgi:hypothetical protein